MHRLHLIVIAVVSTLCVLPIAADETAPPVRDDTVRDGKLFDPGVTFEAPADGAPKALARLQPFIGDWDLELEIRQPGGEVLRSTGSAKITFMNRGHAVMERTRIADFDGKGHPMATLAFLAVDANGVWTVGGGQQLDRGDHPVKRRL